MKKELTLIFFILNFAIIRSTEINTPIDNPKAIVASGNARFTVLTPELIRQKWSENGIFEGRISLVFINRNLPAPNFRVKIIGEWLCIETDKLYIRYRENSGLFKKENLEISLESGGEKITWSPGLQDKGNLKGTIRTLDGTNGATELEQGIISKVGWALVDDSERLLFDGSYDLNCVIQRPEWKRQDWYFFGYGYNYKKALYDFSVVAGKIPLPPKYVFGYWWLRYWIYSDPEMRELINEFKAYNIPIDVLIIDLDWHETRWLDSHNSTPDPFGQAVSWTGYTWSTWQSLAFQPYFTSTASNVGYGNWSHDIGGHASSEYTDPELYLRWIQFGVFSPILRTHSTKSANIERRI